MSGDQAAQDIRDNYYYGTVAGFLRDNLHTGAQVSIVSAYFTIYAYDGLKNELESIEHLDFLLGEPKATSQVDPEESAKQQFVISHEGLTLYKALTLKRVSRECADWIRRKVAIKTLKQSNLLHGKMYHIQRGEVSRAILGSSNFTVPGLGLADNRANIELNLIVDSDRSRRELKLWFDQLWRDEQLVRDAKEELLRILERVYGNHAPSFIYFLTLYRIFKHELDSVRDIEDKVQRGALPESAIWRKLFLFQKDGAKAAINKLLTHNGCILADSVGLGKTYTALAVIKYFELRNERVLVLCPKKLSENWTIYNHPDVQNLFADDHFRFDVLHHTDLSREQGVVNGINLANLNWGAYDLVVIDESHNFRNNKFANQRQQPGQRSRYQRLMEDIIRSGGRTKVLLLSATPVNNELADLRNQISFIAGGDVSRDPAADSAFKDSLGIHSVANTTRHAQARFTEWAKKAPEKRQARDLLSAIGGDFFHLLDGLSIARSRRHIIQYYSEEMTRLGGFPQRQPPVALHPPIDLAGRLPSFTQFSDEIDKLVLALYHPTLYLRDKLPPEILAAYQDKIHGGFTQEGRERILIAMMKVNLLKRLESSVHSFRETLRRTLEKIDTLEIKIKHFQKHQDENPEVAYDFITLADLDEETAEAMTIGGRRRVHLGHLKLAEWLQAVRHDRVQLQYLQQVTSEITPARDGKLAELTRLITAKAMNPTCDRDGRPNRKVLVFTAFADTASYLHEHLRDIARGKLGLHLALIRGDGNNATSFGQADYNHILTHFSPRSKERALKARAFADTSAEIDLLIATDCISEGQNLQDCDLLINYDIHWNPVRIIQRFGRIDRIGSRNATVSLVNFWPVPDLDKYLGVKYRVEARMALVDLTATQTDNPLDQSTVESLIKDELRYRDRQLCRLKDEIIDLEDFGDSITLTDFSLDEFRLELLRYINAHREELDAAVPGLHAVVAANAKVKLALPGAIFCLRHRPTAALPGTPAPAVTAVNPLAPYLLIYVHDDGTVRFSFTQPKEALRLMRELAAGEDAANARLCERFDQATNAGADMAHYSQLIMKVLAAIPQTSQRRTLSALSQGRGAVLPPASTLPSANPDDYELVTWLAILPPIEAK